MVVLLQYVPFCFWGIPFLIVGNFVSDSGCFYITLHTHADDAVCIAAYGAPVSGVADRAHTFEVRQFRRHDRALIRSQRERAY